ncbi:MAG: hypothetical protein AAF633_08895 [Chloroflexota bacterium]
MQFVEEIIQRHLERYSAQCRSLFVTLIDAYKSASAKENIRLECVCEAGEDHRLALTFMSFPQQANYGQVLNDEDDRFMREPVFLTPSDQQAILKQIEDHLTAHDIDEDEYDLFHDVTFDLVPAWLSRCWLDANQLEGSEINLFYFIHRYPNHPPINLLNGEQVRLDDIM